MSFLSICTPRARRSGRMSRRWRPTPLIKLSLAIHAAALAGAAVFPGRWRLVLGLLAANHAVLTGAGLAPRSVLLGPNLSRLPRSATEHPAVGLTFDDGPDPVVTPRVLDLLGERGAEASFFCIGRRAEKLPDLVAEISRRGHFVENHTYRHHHGFAFFGPGRLAAEIDAAQDAVHSITGREPVYFRAPSGIRNPMLEPLLAARDLRLASWTRRGLDGIDENPDRILRRLLRGLAAGDLLVLHDGNSWHRRRRAPAILEVLPRLLDVLAKRRLRAVALPSRRPGAKST